MVRGCCAVCGRFLLALLVGFALSNGDFVEGAALWAPSARGSSVRAGAGDVPGDAHDHPVAGARLRQFRNQRPANSLPPP